MYCILCDNNKQSNQCVNAKNEEIDQFIMLAEPQSQLTSQPCQMPNILSWQIELICDRLHSDVVIVADIKTC